MGWVGYPSVARGGSCKMHDTALCCSKCCAEHIEPGGWHVSARTQWPCDRPDSYRLIAKHGGCLESESSAALNPNPMTPMIHLLCLNADFREVYVANLALFASQSVNSCDLLHTTSFVNTFFATSTDCHTCCVKCHGSARKKRAEGPGSTGTPRQAGSV